MQTIQSSILISFLVAGTFLIAGGKATALETSATPGDGSGRNVLIIGHSLTHCLRGLEPLAPMVGHPAHKQMLYTFLGAGIAYHYQTETNQWTPVSWRKLYFGPDKKWDALIMSAGCQLERPPVCQQRRGICTEVCRRSVQEQSTLPDLHLWKLAGGRLLGQPAFWQHRGAHREGGRRG